MFYIMLSMCNMVSPDTSILKIANNELATFEKMNPKPLTYADVLKNQSGFLNPGMNPVPLIPKAPRVRLSEDAKVKL